MDDCAKGYKKQAAIVTTREQVLLNFLRCQQNNCKPGEEMRVTLTIRQNDLVWQRELVKLITNK
jgi:hypothetical protein